MRTGHGFLTGLIKNSESELSTLKKGLSLKKRSRIYRIKILQIACEMLAKCICVFRSSVFAFVFVSRSQYSRTLGVGGNKMSGKTLPVTS